MVDDTLPSTHPIDAPCKDNEEAQGLLDGISYGKGAVFLNQVIKSIGESVFFDGCKAYFQKFAWQNTELKDFVQCLNDSVSLNKKPTEQFQFNVHEFSDIWLKNSGCN